MSDKEKRRWTGKKISDFHIEIIRKNINKIVTGELNTKQALTLLNEQAKLKNEVQIKDKGTVKRMVYKLLEGQPEKLETYREALAKNTGGTSNKERRIKAKKMREEVAKYQVVSSQEFLALSEEEQDQQIMMKVRQQKLKEENEQKTNRVQTEETTVARMEKTKQYFRKKEAFSEEEIRYMIFLWPSLLNLGNETLDKKLEILTSYEEIDEEEIYNMLKRFPAMLGYSEERTKAQLDLLQKEHLIKCIINRPRELMKSVGLMYALIQYAKERYKTDNLSNISGTKILTTNSILKRLYGTTYEEIKKRFPYESSEQDIAYTITKGAIKTAIVQESTDVLKVQEAFQMVHQFEKEKENREEI